MIAEPTRRSRPSATRVWALQQAAFWIVVTIVVLVAIGGGRFLDRARAAVAPAFWACCSASPSCRWLRWRRWRWDVDDDAIDIRHGTFTVRRTLVPLVRVQHVDTRRGMLEQVFDLATVVVHTAAGSHKIPLLTDHQADDLRDRIADLARDRR